MKKLIIRCDAGNMVGWGHIKRCFTLAKSLKESFVIKFVVKSNDPHKVTALLNGEFKVQFLDEKLSITEEVDHYIGQSRFILLDISHTKNLRLPHSFSNYLNQLHEAKFHIMLIDGDGDERLSISNTPTLLCYIQPYFMVDNLPRVRYQYWLKGSQYLLVDRKYFLQRNLEKIDCPNNFAISFGGSDPQWNSLKVLNGILHSNHYDHEFKIVIGPSFSEELISELTTKSKKFPNIECIFSPPDLVKVFEWAHLCVGAASTTRFEAAASQLPMIFVSLYPEHEKLSLKYNSLGIAQYLGLCDNITRDIWSVHLNNFYEISPSYAKMKQRLSQLTEISKGPGLLTKKLAAITRDII